MMEGDMECWRSYFGKAGVDIWSVIRQAIHVAAMDYPMDFGRMRGEIAETLFARELVQLHSTHVKAEVACTLEEGKVGHDARQMVKTQAEANDFVDEGTDDVGKNHLICHDEAEAFSDELEEESLVFGEVNTIKETCIDADQPENFVFEALQRLKYMHITVQVLKVTEIGKKVNGLRKHPSIRVRSLVKELVRHWKVLVDEWMVAAKEVTAATITASAGTERGEFLNQEDGLASPPLDEGALLNARASPVELSQLFSFINEDMCVQLNDREAPAASSVEPSVKDYLNHSSLSQSGSMLTDSSDVDAKASTSHPWGLRTSEERGSATRDRIEIHERETVLRAKEAGYIRASQDGGGLTKHVPNYSGPGRPASDTRKVELTSSTQKSAGTLTGISRNGLVHKNVAMQVNDGSIPAMKSDKCLADQKLEIAKRKLHQGYQEAENAKKQRTVQVLEVVNLPKSGETVRARVKPPPLHVKSGPQRSQNGRYS